MTILGHRVFGHCPPITGLLCFINSQVAAESTIQFTNEEGTWNTSILAPGSIYTGCSRLRVYLCIRSRKEISIPGLVA